MSDGILHAAFGVYTGTSELKDGPVRVFPMRLFLEALTSGRVLD